jgi:glycosyltransferase involved in cell wall biosynthesis
MNSSQRETEDKTRQITNHTRVSVIVPVYNRQALGERALLSVVAQNLEAMEIIVVDDASSTPFRLPASLSDLPNVRLIRLDTNIGESGSRNVGVAAARGPWIAFLDSDDYWLPGTLEPRLAAAEANWTRTGAMLTVHVAGFVVHNKRTGQYAARIPLPSRDPKMFASGCWFGQGSTSLLRRETFERVGPCDVNLRRLQDLDWYLRLALLGGQIKVWDGLAAVVETGHKPSIKALETALSHLKAKYLEPTGSAALPPHLKRRLKAYFDVERASVHVSQEHWARSVYYLARSFLRAPRLSVHLERFWRYQPLHDDLSRLLA